MTLAKNVAGVAPAGDHYLDLVRTFPLRVLRSEDDLDRASETLDSIGGDLTPDVHEYRLALAALIERYEDEHHPIPVASPSSVIRHLMEAREVTQSDVVAESGVPASTLSEILSSKREMSRGVMAKLATYFKVDPGVFAGSM